MKRGCHLRILGNYILIISVLCSMTLITTCRGEDYTLKIGENKTFYTMNGNTTAFLHDDYFSTNPIPLIINSWVEGNTLNTHILANNDEAGVALVTNGIHYDWDIGNYQWEGVQNVPVIVKISGSYKLFANYERLDLMNGSSNAMLGVSPFQSGRSWPNWAVPGINCVDWVGPNSPQLRGDKEGTFNLMFLERNGQPLTIGNLGNDISIWSFSHATTKPIAMVKSEASTQSTITEISIEFPVKPQGTISFDKSAYTDINSWYADKSS